MTFDDAHDESHSCIVNERRMNLWALSSECVITIEHVFVVVVAAIAVSYGDAKLQLHHHHHRVEIVKENIY